MQIKQRESYHSHQEKMLKRKEKQMDKMKKIAANSGAKPRFLEAQLLYN